MSKVIFWIVVVFAALLGLRLLNAAKARQRADAARRQRDAGGPAIETMVRCARCGVFVPRADALPGPAGPTCRDAACARR
jgi:uncharacterized protein